LRRKKGLWASFWATVQPKSGSKPSDELGQFGQRAHVRLTKLRQPLAVFGGVLAGRVEQVVADEDARHVDVASQAPQPRLDAPMMLVELLELRVDGLRLVPGRHHRSDDQQEQAGQRHRHDGPRSEPHSILVWSLSGNVGGGIRQTPETASVAAFAPGRPASRVSTGWTPRMVPSYE
jgi:hypothetical protein